MIVTARKLNLYCYACLSIHSRGEGEEKEEGKMERRRRRREEEEGGKSREGRK